MTNDQTTALKLNQSHAAALYLSATALDRLATTHRPLAPNPYPRIQRHAHAIHQRCAFLLAQSVEQPENDGDGQDDETHLGKETP